MAGSRSRGAVSIYRPNDALGMYLYVGDHMPGPFPDAAARCQIVPISNGAPAEPGGICIAHTTPGQTTGIWEQVPARPTTRRTKMPKWVRTL